MLRPVHMKGKNWLMRVSLFDSGFQKILFTKICPPLLKQIYLPDTILKAEVLGLFEMLAHTIDYSTAKKNGFSC